jgi:hypothetical protein
MKVLILHGYQNNSKILFYQSKFLRSILKYNFIIPNAPNITFEKPKNINTNFFPQPYFYWYGKNTYELNNSINFITTLGNFDGIIGFSQGSAMALHMLDIINPKFFISIAGVNPDTNCNYNIPSFHFIGKNDPINDKSIKLLNMFNNPNFIYFNGGHEFPPRNCKNDYITCNEFIKKFE